MKPIQPLSLDHLVITTRFNLDRARGVFSQLGFTLAPMGRHAFGSINHLILFRTCFLELIGVPREGLQRKEVLDAHKGIDGLVYKTLDADALHAALEERGLAVQPLHAFGRTIERHGQQHEVLFRTVRAVPGSFEAGRVYYCQHLTPELMWLPEYQTHRNGAVGQTGLTLVTQEPAAQAASFAQWAGVSPRNTTDGFGLSTGGFSIEIITPTTYVERYGDLGCTPLGRRSFFGAIHLATGSMEAVREMLAAQRDNPALQVMDAGSSISVLIGEFNCLLVFEPAVG